MKRRKHHGEMNLFPMQDRTLKTMLLLRQMWNKGKTEEGGMRASWMTGMRCHPDWLRKCIFGCHHLFSVLYCTSSDMYGMKAHIQVAGDCRRVAKAHKTKSIDVYGLLKLGYRRAESW